MKNKKDNIETKENNIDYHEATFKCVACGNTFKLRTTKKGSEVTIEICNNCHPFYTGTQQKYIETGGRIEKFNKRMSKIKTPKKKVAKDSKVVEKVHNKTKKS